MVRIVQLGLHRVLAAGLCIIRSHRPLSSAAPDVRDDMSYHYGPVTPIKSGLPPLASSFGRSYGRLRGAESPLSVSGDTINAPRLMGESGALPGGSGRGAAPFVAPIFVWPNSKNEL
jgi:hypothetical protein